MSHYYSNHKFLLYPDKVEAVRERRVTPPVHIRIKPINHCNHNCWYCAYRADQLQLGEGIDLKDKIPEAKMFEIADDIVSLGVKAVTFSGGGEPLIYKPLPEVINRLGEGGVKVASLTNGSNLKGKVADAFSEHGTWVRVSMDAWDDDSYAQSRGVKVGEFSRIIDNIRGFIERQSGCVLGVSYIISRDNFEHIYTMCEMLKGIGVNHVKLAAAVVSNDAKENNDYHRDHMAAVTAQITKAQTLSEPGFTVLNHFHEAEERFTKQYTTCPYLTFLTVIGADCSVYACQDKAYNDKGLLGSIKDQKFSEFWLSDENRDRVFGLNPSVDCQHHCVTHAKNVALFEHFETPMPTPRDIDGAHGAFV